MEIVKVVPSGFCKGVINAILMVKKTIEIYPDQPIYILGMLVHNRYVVEAFQRKGVITLSGSDKWKMLDEIDHGVVVFTAHGINPKIKAKALEKGLTVVDASCADVISNSNLTQKYLNDGYEVLYIGKKNHPESEALCSLSDHIHLISDEDSLNRLSLCRDKILITNQTTMSSLDTSKMMEKLLKLYPEAIAAPEICKATLMRQKAVMDLKDFDALIVVGDPSSNNTLQLANIALESRIAHVFKIESAKDIADTDFSSFRRIAVTAGASTPRYLTDNVISYLQTSDPHYLQIDLDQILQF